MIASAPVVEVRNLRVTIGPPGPRQLRVVDGVDFTMAAGETLALVGESGSGKSVTALALTRLLPETTFATRADGLTVLGRDILSLSARGLRSMRGKDVAYVFQDPSGTLNPVLRVGDQVAEVIRLHDRSADARAESLAWLQRVGLNDAERVYRSYPHQLSGGMQQRAVIAMALAGRPRLLIADEPTTALDVTVQAQVLRLLVSLRKELDFSVLLITHNLGLVAGLADRVMVMYAGGLVEAGPTRDLLQTPRHPYTQALLRAVPRLTGPRAALEGIPGSVPHPAALPCGCRFHPRCPIARADCSHQPPAWRTITEAHRAACPYGEEGRDD